jgi:hypothetical protein
VRFGFLRISDPVGEIPHCPPDRPVLLEIRKAISVQKQATIASSTPRRALRRRLRYPLLQNGKTTAARPVNLPALVKIVIIVVQIFGYKDGKIVQTGSGFIAENGAVVTNFSCYQRDRRCIYQLSNGARKHVLGLAFSRAPTAGPVIPD